jgi:anionic cell wall polymer biosynthesis LytR-Cps2A-Psr (LCP) family protein
MGLVTWITIVVLILAIIGLGWHTFVSGVFKGAEKIINGNPEIKNITEKAKQYIVNVTKNASEELIDNTIGEKQSSTTQSKEEEEKQNYAQGNYLTF